MKTIIRILIIACLILNAKAQTPFDLFAPDVSRPMLQLEPETLKDTVSGKTISNLQKEQIKDDIRKWLSVDPLADKYPNISPYAYCGWNPINAIDPDGRDIYRYDNETGDIRLYQKTDDNFDQFGKFKYNRKTKEYEPRTKRDGSIDTYTDHKGKNDKIAKGILRDGLNIKQNGSNFILDNNVGPTIDDYFNFALILDEVAGVEISGYVLGAHGDQNKRIVKFEPYKDNFYNRSRNRIMNFSPYSVLQHFHTHGHANTYYEATTPSEDFDVPFKNKLSSLYPDIQLLILHNYGLPIKY